MFASGTGTSFFPSNTHDDTGSISWSAKHNQRHPETIISDDTISETVSLFVRTLLVVQVFSALATAAYYFPHLQQASVGLEQAFDHHCPAPSLEHGARKGAGIGAYIPYTGNHSLDYIACLMTNFFYILLTPPLRTANIPLIMAIPVPWFAILLDAITLFPRSRLLAIGVPALLGVLIQLK